MAICKTVKAGFWHDKTVWDVDRVPTIGDRVEVNHFIVAQDSVAVGDGSLYALILNAPLICQKSLSVIGTVYGNEGGGLAFLSDDFNWFFYASAGFVLAPITYDYAVDQYEAVFGSQLGQGYFLPISGRVLVETYLSPHKHTLIDAILTQIKGLNGVWNATHNPQAPSQSIIVVLDTLNCTVDELLNVVAAVDRLVTNAVELGFNFTATLDTNLDLTTSAWVLMQRAVGDPLIGMTETDTEIIFSISETATYQVLVLATSAATQIQQLLSRLGLTKSCKVVKGYV